MQPEPLEHVARRRLPNRREGETHELEIDGKRYLAGLGFYPDGRVGEIFLSSGKVGSQINSTLADAAILVSRCLQGGTPASELARSMSRIPRSISGPATEPASAIGGALDLAVEFERPEAG